MESFYDLLTTATHSPRASNAATEGIDKRRIFADDIRDLYKMIESEQRRGWVLVARTYSMDDGHGATLVRKDLGKAA